MGVHPARRLWQLVEPYHAVTYFAPEAHRAYVDVGLRGFWRGYFAGRAAPFGAVEPGPVVAAFFGFHPDFVARAVPAVWSSVTPAQASAARLDGVDRSIRRLFLHETDDRFRRAAGLLHAVLDDAPAGGRPLYAANRGLARPDRPHLALWHAATLLREHRGDGHVIALTAAGFDPCEAHVSQVAAAGTSLDTVRPHRGWRDGDWDAAADRLRSRGLLDTAGGLTERGRAARRRIEDETDRLTVDPRRGLGESRLDELFRLVMPLAHHLMASGTIPYPNPMGVPRPSPGP